MNYRHAFHAGNHADVLKHIALLALCDALTAKPAALFALDTHAGRGLYALDGCLTFFPKRLDALTPIGSGSYVQVVLTRDAEGRVVGYVDGVRQFAFDDDDGLAKVGRSSTLRFFVDDHTTTGEYSSGAVSQIRLFDQPLTEREVAALACTELAIADATFACRELQQ